jgi:hypothetical protein
MKNSMKKLLLVALIGAGVNSLQAMSPTVESPGGKPVIAQDMNNTSCQSMPTEEGCEPAELCSVTRDASDSVSSDASVHTVSSADMMLGDSVYDYVSMTNEAIADELIKLLSTDKVAFKVLHDSPYLKDRIHTIMEIANAKELDCFIRRMLRIPARDLLLLQKALDTQKFKENASTIVSRCIWMQGDIYPMTLLRKAVEGYLLTYNQEYVTIVKKLLTHGASVMWLNHDLSDSFFARTHIQLRCHI